MSDFCLKPISEEYLFEVTAIYNHYIEHTTTTFHAHTLTPHEMRALVFFDQMPYQTHVIIEESTVCGYVLLTRHKPREAYYHLRRKRIQYSTL